MKKPKKIGLIGGISWVSTAEYYKYINEGINQKLGGLHFAECVLYSLNFGELQEITWDHAYKFLLEACRDLQKTGVEAIALCANTAHLYADELQKEIGLPFIHIAIETSNVIKQKGLRTVALLGTSFTMERSFYKNKLEEAGLTVLIPEGQETRDYLQMTIRDELGRGEIKAETKARYQQIIQQLIDRGAEGVILGCTEIPLLLKQSDLTIPAFDTTQIHSDAIVAFSLS